MSWLLLPTLRNGMSVTKKALPCYYSNMIMSSTTTTTIAKPTTATARWIASASQPLSMPLYEFRDQVPREQRAQERVGRSWGVKELRLKSFEDLHKLWLVLYKELNMILTESNLSRRRQIVMPQPDRKQKVKKSMKAIRVVLGERKREKISQHALRMLEREEELRGQEHDE